MRPKEEERETETEKTPTSDRGGIANETVATGDSSRAAEPRQTYAGGTRQAAAVPLRIGSAPSVFLAVGPLRPRRCRPQRQRGRAPPRASEQPGPACELTPNCWRKRSGRLRGRRRRERGSWERERFSSTALGAGDCEMANTAVSQICQSSFKPFAHF